MATARRLQAPGGCAWDRAQTVQSLLPYLIEEAWEVFEAARGRRRQDLQAELGDLLYTVLFMTLIAERRRHGNLRSLLRQARAKMIRRHPHVFGAHPARTPREAYNRWQEIKRREGGRHSRSKTLRPVLVASWEWLRTDSTAAPRLSGVIRRARPRSRARSKKPSARPGRATAR